MQQNLPPYQNYKPSGVDWLGEVPAHWETCRLGRILRERGEKNANGKVTQVLSLLRERGVIPYDEKGNIGNKKSDDITRYKIVKPNDIVMNCMNVIIGSVGLASSIGCLSPVYYVLVRRHDDEPRYINAIFQCPSFHRSLIKIGNGILDHRMRIPMELLKCELLPRPPLPEQKAIVRFLDYVEQRIRRYLKAKKKLLILLEEQKQALIHHAVTRGLNPATPLKDSGIEWLGKIPAHWQIQRLKDISKRELNGTTPSTENSAYYSSDGIPWYGPPSLGPHIDIGDPIRHVSHQAITERKVKIISPPALAVSVIGNVGRCALIHDQGTTNQQITCFELCKNICNPYFVTYQFRFAEKNLIASASSATISILDSMILRSIKLALPSIPEQKSIVKYLNKTTTKIDAAIARTRREIDLLSEYRTRLIADVVSGKVDVRGSVKGKQKQELRAS